MVAPRLGSILVALVLVTLGATALASPTSRPAAAQVPAELQADDVLWRVVLTDGSTLIGRVVATDEATVTLLTDAGVRVELTRAQIHTMSAMRGEIRDGRVWIEDPNRTRLLFAPTGRMLEGGEGYAGVFELFFPFVAMGVTDFITLAGGTPIVPGVIGRIAYLAPKARIHSGDGIDLAGGVMAVFNLDGADFDSAGIAYGVGTFGTLDNAFTAGVGWGFAGGEISNRPLFMAGGETRVGRMTKLVSENYLITYRDGPDTAAAGLLSLGVRVFGEQLSADAGIGLGFDRGDTFCCLPLVNFVYNFGGGR